MMKKKKIALITCYYQPNYGSQLQAYATQLIFDKMGVPNETICIDKIRAEINNAKYKYFIKHILNVNVFRDKLGFIKHIYQQTTRRGFRKNIYSRNDMYKKFSVEKFHLSFPYGSKNELHTKACEYAAFVLGSDQLWLPSNIEADYYTLNFVPIDIPKIAYSTSFGVSQLLKTAINKAKVFLNRFDSLSVREQSGQEIIKELINKQVPVVCDPTLLFTASEWDTITTKKRLVEEKYIFCYFLGDNPAHRCFAKRLKEKTNYKIVQLQHLDKYIKSDNNFPDIAPYDIGPTGFIQLISDAEYVLTDSFHASIFSMLYKKDFFSFKRYNKDNAVSTNTRLYSLLTSLHAKNRLLTSDESIDDVLLRQLDYNIIHDEIATLRTFSINYIKKALAQAGINYDSNYK